MDRVFIRQNVGQNKEKRVDVIPPDLSELTESQQLLLEKENAALMDKLSTDLEQVEQATQSLQEIADLQSTLAFHLSAQQEMIETIHTDAQESVSTMENAHLQLVKTQKYFGEARLWVFIFLVIASAILLFLDYYGS